MLPKDYVRLRLCGERATDVADASGTLLLDVAQRRWSLEVLDALELDGAWLPEALESPAVSGRTPDGVPVAAGAGDQAAGALGVGVDKPGPLSVVLGTSGVVFAALERFAADAQARLHAFCHSVPGAWHHSEQYANNRIEADHGQLKRRLRPMRGLKPTAESQSSSPGTHSSKTSAAGTTNSAPTSR